MTRLDYLEAWNKKKFDYKEDRQTKMGGSLDVAAILSILKYILTLDMQRPRSCEKVSEEI